MKNIMKLPKEITKSWMNDVASEITMPVIEGHVDALTEFVKLKALAETIKLAMDKIKEQAVIEATAYPESVTKFGVRAEFQQGRKMRDYSNDSDWSEIKAKLTERENLLKGLTKPMADPDTGELIYPPTEKFSENTIKLTFKK